MLLVDMPRSSVSYPSKCAVQPEHEVLACSIDAIPDEGNRDFFASLPLFANLWHDEMCCQHSSTHGISLEDGATIHNGAA